MRVQFKEKAFQPGPNQWWAVTNYETTSHGEVYRFVEGDVLNIFHDHEHGTGFLIVSDDNKFHTVAVHYCRRVK